MIGLKKCPCGAWPVTCFYGSGPMIYVTCESCGRSSTSQSSEALAAAAWEMLVSGEAPSPSAPAYYLGKSGRDVIDVIEDFSLDFYQGNAISYVIRAGRKTDDPREDYRKAIDTLTRAIAEYERGRG